jgi:FkbM family methyltransferase
MLQLRSFAREIAPTPVKKLVRKALAWRRRAQFRPHTIVKHIGGESFPFYIGDSTAEQWYVPEKDPVVAELTFMRDHMIAPGDLIFDVGSHHGLHAVFLGRGPVRVLAIEPNPHNISILRKNIAVNSLQNVTVRQTAVGNCVGKIALPEDSNEGGVVTRKTDTPTIDVELLPLDHMALQHDFPNLLKIDVEGFEDRVLKGAKEILKRRPKIAIEVHVEWVARYGSSVREVLDLLGLESYYVWVLPYDPTVEEVRQWHGEDMTAYPPPKFTLFLLPR